MAAAAAATATCPGRGWGQPEGIPGGVTPSPPRHFTFDPPVGPSGPPRPRRRHRRVLYPPAVRRPPPTEEPSAAKRLLMLLLAVVSAQVYSAPGDVTPEVAATATVIPETPVVNQVETPMTPAVTSLPGDGVLLRTAVTPMETNWTPNGTLVGTPTAPMGIPMGASCPRLLLSPALRPHSCRAGHAAS
ncbi:PREDICTED: radiation-inducible immediate-early gene IEX-1 [Haliaeetus leucocephalus]|uniref:radiation-inducible immediate-early gene IEX-1 n=1 Tax=Haliaeetus leucocephalus TaxID=52644 RepID=UPI00053CC9F0|nr:PREDICTED: radiation-inducible immediate-early gene IEX-1 [Haliaeetus leucocephalus]